MKNREFWIFVLIILSSLLHLNCNAIHYDKKGEGKLVQCTPFDQNILTFFDSAKTKPLVEKEIQDQNLKVCPRIVSRRSFVGLYAVFNSDAVSFWNTPSHDPPISDFAFHILKFEDKWIPQVLDYSPKINYQMDSILIEFFAKYRNEFSTQDSTEISKRFGWEFTFW